jgi:RNA polymerase sigma-70 factor (ECF subfamily)
MRLRGDEERRLIRRVQRYGDRDAAEALIQKYYDEIYAFIRRQTNCADIARDIAQESFIGFLRTVRGYDPNAVGLRTWLYRIASNKIADYYRSRARSPVVIPLPDDPDAYAALAGGEDLARLVEDGDLAERVNEAAAAMPADAQRVFRLRLYGGFTFPEISSMLGLPANTVKSQYHRLIQTLRKEFRDERPFD